MKFYNTLTKTKENFIPIKKNEVGFYSCGPTVYDYPHIGNLRSYIFADILHRYLETEGYKVKHVINITDVGHLVSDSDSGEDKLEKGAKREKMTAYQLAEKYYNIFLCSLEQLNVERADIYPKATEHINLQIKFIQQLEEKGFTYIINDGVYFDTSKLTDYGKLAELDIKGQRGGSRVEINKEKKNPSDFALWKFSPKNKQRDMEWESPWGIGFPGWHIECSAMSYAYLGDHFDIHSGGIDHIPIHHTNEIAQSEALFGHPFVNYWLHCDFLVVNGEKMSKSKGNFYSLDDIISKYNIDPLDFRMLCLMAHYREKLNFTDDSIIQAKNSRKKIINFVNNLLSTNYDDDSTVRQIDKQIINSEKKFKLALADDINTPKALATIFMFIKELNKNFIQNISKDEAQEVLNFLLDCDRILGLGLSEITKKSVPSDVKDLVEKRKISREKQNWAESDHLRSLIINAGYSVEDTENGQKVRKL